MKSRRTVTSFVALSTILVGLCGTALAGVEPSPWHVVIANSTDRLGRASMFYDRNLTGMELMVMVQSDVVGGGGTMEIVIPIRSEAGENLTLAPGQMLAFA